MRMKRGFLLLLALMLTVSGLAVADTKINPTENRKFKLKEVGLNPIIEYESPTTGRLLSSLKPGSDGFSGLAVNGRYQPMLVQIDNTDNGLNKRAPWGVNYADIVYESPLREEGETRISFLFSDLIPDDVGPIRSARLGHVWLREEWDAGFLYYGQQEYPLTNVLDEFTRLSATKRGVLFSGTAGMKDWKEFYYARKGLKAPHDKGADVASIQGLIPTDIIPPNHTFLFTDETAMGDSGIEVKLDWGKYVSLFRYSESLDAYTRYIVNGKKEQVYKDLDTGESVTFANVIIQFTDVDWVVKDAPVTRNVGDAPFFKRYSTGNFVAQGNADYFMNGVHVEGYWKRENMYSRTVFYGPDGHEMPLQRGRTMIVMFPATERQIHTATNKKPSIIKDLDRSVTYK